MRGLFAFGGDFSNATMTSLNLLAGVIQFEEDLSEERMNSGSFMEADFLVIDFDDNLGALQDSLMAIQLKQLLATTS